MTMSSFYKNNIITVVFFLILFGTVSTIQRKYDEQLHPMKIIFSTETRYIMPASIVKKLSFGFNNVLADVYWINLIQDFSVWNGKDPFYLEGYKNVAALDPDFAYPYLLGILTFTSREYTYRNTDDIHPANIGTFEPVAVLGMKNLPNNWEIPFYLGTAFQLTKDPEKAIKYLKIASENPTAPDLVKRVYQTYIKNILAGKEASTFLLKTIYETTDSKTTKKIIRESAIAKALSAALSAISQDYKAKYGKYPVTINDLIAKKMVRESAELRTDYNVSINQTTGEVLVTAKTKD